MTGKTHLLALDQGTSSSRSIVFAADGSIVAMAQREFRQIFPQPGWVEHDPREIWETQLATAREALATSRLAATDIAAIGITNQRETTLLWNRASGEPLGNAIVWQDRRTAPACEALKQRGLEPLFRGKTGLVLDAYFSGTKLAWLLDNVPGARAAAERGELAFGTVDSWLMWMLTGGGDAATRAGAVHATDASNASRTLLFDIHAARGATSCSPRWRSRARCCPRCIRRATSTAAPSRPARRVDRDRRRRRRPAERPLRPGVLSPGPGQEHLRHRLLHADEHRHVAETSGHGLITTRAAQARAGAVRDRGQRLHRRRGRAVAARRPARDHRSGEVGTLAKSVPDNGGVMFVPAFTGLGAPYWKPDARGTIVGLTRGSTIGHIARAALESIAFQSAALLEAMGKDALAAGAAPVAELRVDGGASATTC
jgi:glycerol kinase